MPATHVWHPVKLPRANAKPAKPRPCKRCLVFIIPLFSRMPLLPGIKPEGRDATPCALCAGCLVSVSPSLIGLVSSQNLLDLPIESGTMGSKL